MILKIFLSFTIVTSTAVLVDYSKDFDYDLMKPISVSEISKKFGNTFEIMLVHNGSADRENSLKAFDYLSEGFTILNNLTFNYSLPAAREIESLAFYKSSFDLFLDSLSDLKYFFHSKFIKIMRDFEHTPTSKITRYFNTLINSYDFKHNLETLNSFITVKTSQEAYEKNVHENIFKTYFEQYKQLKPLFVACDTRSLINLLFNFYEEILTSVIEAYTIMIISYEFEHLRTENYWIYRTQQMDYLSEYWSAIRSVKESAQGMISLLTSEYREYKNCDPDSWIEGEHYIRVKNYVSSTLEMTFSTDSLKTREELGFEFECDQHSLASNGFDHAVYSISCPQIFETVRRDECEKQKEVEDVFSRPGYENWPIKCTIIDEEIPLSEYCSCDKLSDFQLSQRTVNLREQLTDTNNNFVVTGIKFVVKNNMISIQIEEGQLVKGTMYDKSVRWQSGEGKIPRDGVENVTLNYNVKSFNLDDIEVPYGEFVTGVRFKMVDGRLTLAIRGTEMRDDYSSWPSTKHTWYEPKLNANEERVKIDIQDFKNSAEVDMQTNELSRSERDYIDLTVGLYSNTFTNLPIIPFFDSQELVTNPPAPIGGVGLFFKSQPNYGGFLAFKLFESQYNYKF